MKVEILRSVEPRIDVERQIGRLVTVKFNIEYMGWGYTLTALELAVLYSGHEDIVNSSGRLQYLNLPDDVILHLEKYGMSGNQDDWALFVARSRHKEKK